MSPPAIGPPSDERESVCPDRPYISVILMASRHPEFVGEAIRSVREQSLPLGEVELVAVRDFHDEGVERMVREANGKDVRVPPGRIGPAIEAGVKASHGDVVAFLDDDDRFLREKLATVAGQFRKDPGLGFYRNGYEVIDPPAGGSRITPSGEPSAGLLAGSGRCS